MATLAALTFFVLFAAGFVGTCVYLVLMHFLFRRLLSHHMAAYESLGSPTLFLNNSIQNGFRVLRWLWRKEFLDLADNQTVRLAGIVRVLFVGLTINFLELFALFILFGVAIDARIA
ncbi:MAG TPA: hypothetical protein VFS52_22115 [Steroidobacteraceae bacterium]|jgi:hypothetical protein|nr:hypothetical protein [Steroidobacteraceae bacterium]